MNAEYIIMDCSVTRMNARNVLEEGLFLVDFEKDQWCKNYQEAKKYPSSESAVEIARKITNLSKLPRIFTVQAHQMGINVTEIKY